jgi:hypothetical protein
MRKYRRFGRRAARKRFSGRRKKTFRYSRRRKRISKLRKRWARKRRNIRRARRRGNWQTFTAKRVNQVSLEIDLNAAPGPDAAHLYKADALWYGHTKSLKAIQDKYSHHWLKSLSFKFNNFKVRTMMRTVTTEGGTETTSEQILEPSYINMRYRWDKWGDGKNPGTMVGHDDRIEEIMQTKCVKNCYDKFWGIWKPKGARALLHGPVNGDESWGHYVKKMKCRNVDEHGPPHLGFWFCAENTLPDQFFKPDPYILHI